MTGQFVGLAGILVMSAVGGVVARILKQPVILGYLLSGMVFALFGGLADWEMKSLLEMLGQLGVTLLLFLVGLELPLAELKRTGKEVFGMGVSQILFTSLLGFGVSKLLGFGVVESVYLGLAMTFSSTIVVVKLLSEKKDLQSLYGKISIGILLVQDFVAIGILVVLSGVGQVGQLNFLSLFEVLLKGVLAVGLVMWMSSALIPRLFVWVSRSSELLFTTALAWCLGLAVLAASPRIGFTMEIGGFLAGLALSGAVAHFEIAAKVKPLRDFFLTLFFVSLGARSVGEGMTSISWMSVGFLSLFVLIGNPLVVMVLSRIAGYRRRTGFFAGLTMAQISEFSLVLLAVANKLGHVGHELVGVVSWIGIITMMASSYLMLYSEKLYKHVNSYIKIFEPKSSREGKRFKEELSGHVVLFGHNRAGSLLYPVLSKLGRPVVVVDFDPTVVEDLIKKGANAVYGDMSDPELYEEISLSKAALVVSTVPDTNDSLHLLHEVGKHHKRPALIFTAVDNHEAERLYKRGADFVLVPHTVGGDFLAGMLTEYNLEKLDDFRSHVGHVGDKQRRRYSNYV